MKTLDTRDLYKRKCELEELRDAVASAREELEEAQTALVEYEDSDPSIDPEGDNRAELEEAVADAENNLATAEADFDDDEKAELDELETLENEVSEFMHGETMIPERFFEDYARELAEDIHGRAIRDATWPFTCIDWSDAADELRMDYSEVEYQGETYLVRS